jgi:hypothetical protein
MAYAFQRAVNSAVHYEGMYVDPDGVNRSAGTFRTTREAVRAAHREEGFVLQGRWHDSSLGAVSFRDYVEKDWLPSKHIEATTKTASVANLNKHFFPFFGGSPMAKITPWLVPDWVAETVGGELSPGPVRKYHEHLSILKRTVKDQLIATGLWRN